MSETLHYYTHVAYKVGDPTRIYGPFDTHVEAFAYGQPFAEEGLDVEIRTDVLVCDFCGSVEGIGWSYPAKDFAVMEPDIGWGSRGGWAACETCHNFIEDNDRNELAKRSEEVFWAKDENQFMPDLPVIRDQVRQHIKMMHGVFFEVRLGRGKKGADPNV